MYLLSERTNQTAIDNPSIGRDLCFCSAFETQEAFATHHSLHPAANATLEYHILVSHSS
jgi:hypothetical protein